MKTECAFIFWEIGFLLWCISLARYVSQNCLNIDHLEIGRFFSWQHFHETKIRGIIIGKILLILCFPDPEKSYIDTVSLLRSLITAILSSASFIERVLKEFDFKELRTEQCSEFCVAPRFYLALQ